MPPIELKGLKPPRWSWNRSLLEPRFQELARGLVFLVPAWGGVPPVDVVSGEIAVTVGVSPGTQMAKGYPAIGLNAGANGYGWSAGQWRKAFPTGITAIAMQSYESNAHQAEAPLLSIHNGTIRKLRIGTDGSERILRAWLSDGIVNIAEFGVGGRAENDNAVLMFITSGVLEFFLADTFVESIIIGTGPDVGGKDTDNDSGGYPSALDFSADTLYLGENPNDSGGAVGTILFGAMWDRTLSRVELDLVQDDPFGLFRPALLETETADDDRSGSGTIVETHTVIGVGRKNATNTGAITHGHTVVGAGTKAGLGTGAISLTANVVASGRKNALGTGAISHSHTVVATGTTVFTGRVSASPARSTGVITHSSGPAKIVEGAP